MTICACLARRGRGWSVGAGVGVVGALLSSVVHAQDPASEPAAAGLDSMITVTAAKVVRVVGPKQVTIDPATGSATVRLYNPDVDTAVVNVFLQFAPPANAKPALASSLLEEDAGATDSMERARAREDSLERLWSLEKWVKEPLPVKLWLAPHQTVTLTLHAGVPPELAPGEYAAHLVVSTMLVKALPSFGFTLPKDFGGNVQLGGAEVVWKPVMFLEAPEMFYPRATVKLMYRSAGGFP